MESDFFQTTAEVLIILVSAKAMGELFERFRQPAVLGELLVGIVLGPTLLGVIHPHENPVISYLAELGIIILLFQVGAESDLSALLGQWRRSVVVAFLGVLLPLGLGYGYGMLTGQATLAALFIGATLAATSIGITIRVLADLGKVHSPEGMIILGAAILDDILALVLLSILGETSRTGSLSLLSLGQTLVLVALFLLLSITMGIRFAPFLFSVIHRMQVQGVLIVAALVFCLGLALLSMEIGLAAIVGAFAAGLMLERVEAKEHITQRVTPLADLFVPFFFVQAGALFDFGVLARGDILLDIAILGLIAVVGKLASGLGTHGSAASSLVVGLGMLPRGEVGLIFAAFGLERAILTGEIYSVLLAVIMITTFLAPVLLRPALKR